MGMVIEAMRFSELSVFWIESRGAKKLRIILTLSAIAIGIAALSSAFSILDGAVETVNSILTGSGGKFIVIYPKAA